MFKQRHPQSHHIPTVHDHQGLGRDDPVWSSYVEAATKWDEDLVKGWNQGMDIILIFAGLFSAIVTAFLIESYKSLKQDNEDIIATSTTLMVGLLHAISTGQPSRDLNATVLSSPPDFEPTTTAILINAAWFLSLTLSITVALLAMLVKQWGEGYRLGHGLTAPYTQARTRQARYDKLKKWRTEDIILALPVMMHIALGLFIFGLVLFLKDLSRVVSVPVIIMAILTAIVYLVTTLLPLCVTFCPYNTPLSSGRLWNYFWNKFVPDFIVNKEIHRTSRQKENELAQRTTPDVITARALEWLLSHTSQDRETVDTAIDSLSNTTLDSNVWIMLAHSSLVKLVIQRFTAIFSGILDNDVDGIELKDDTQARKALLYGQVLVNLVKQLVWETIVSAGTNGFTGGFNHHVPEGFPDGDRIIAVERGLFL
ncbi:hypothetical protein RSOLAG22IIIB_09339 [Rhizoctonia solani]|uniref:DUF6535 domain-containing protein n=1 Tax=Rhizoctonia solani TaxID=456999 RepID=A0A0K6FXX5_9AGAM|nr:hypothetical protein RSOLAG22IIIB_09339 [Rhizoctonia solani]